MARTVDLTHETDISSTGVVNFTGPGKKIPARGHDRWSLSVLTKTAGGAPNVAVELKGTNDPDPAGTSGETLIDIAGISTATTTEQSTETSGHIRNAYKYVFVNVSAATDLVIDQLRVYGAGFSGQE